jgi:hypothetical protein
VGALNSAHIFGTLVPVEEPSTASISEVRGLSMLVNLACRSRHVVSRAAKSVGATGQRGFRYFDEFP